MQKLKKYGGFTLIELLVVIAIIGFLAVAVLVSLNSARAKSRDARRVSDMYQIQTALELYYNDCGGYPAALTTAAAAPCPGMPFYLNTVPANPTPGGAAYTYAQAGTITGAYSTSYKIGFTLEGPVSNLTTGPNCAQSSGINAGACP
jgi:prepilin-type N-terminal cleavage/methylation domain-containing protein